MENQEKKWFVYLGDRHEGPFSMEEIRSKMASGIVTQEHFVWKEGMADWKVMNQVPDFGAAAPQSASVPAPTAILQQNPVDAQTATAINPEQNSTIELSTQQLQEAMSPQAQPQQQEQPQPQPQQVQPVGDLQLQQPQAFPDSTNTAVAPTQNMEQPVSWNMGNNPGASSPQLAQPSPLESQNPNPNPSSGQSLSLNQTAGMNTAAVELPKEATPMPFEAVELAQTNPFQATPAAAKQAMQANPVASTPFDAQEIERLQRGRDLQRKESRNRWGDMGDPLGEVKRSRPTKLYLFLLIFGLVVLGQLGYLEPVTSNPIYKDTVGKALDTVRPLLTSLSDKIPLVGELVSPEPSQVDASVADLSNLRKVATSAIDTAGPQVAIGLSKADVNHPKFFVSTNFSEPVNFEVLLVGHSDTLLNQISLEQQKRMIVDNHWGTTGVFELEAKQKLPPGHYSVFVFESLNQSDSVRDRLASMRDAPRQPPNIDALGGSRKKLVSFNTYFLGGTDNETYRNLLKQFHQGLQKRSKDELEQLSEYSTRMKKNFDTSLEDFERLRKGSVTATKRQGWARRTEKRVEIARKIASGFVWQGDQVKNQYFHSNLFILTKETVGKLLEFYQFQDSYLTGSPDRTTFESQLSEIQAGAQDSLAKLLAKVKRAKELGSTPNGMPQRVK